MYGSYSMEESDSGGLRGAVCEEGRHDRMKRSC
jgi:hypothetical protein